MQDTNKPMSGGYLEFSSGTINSRSHRKQKYSTVHDCEPFDGCGSKLQNSFGDSEFFHGVGNNSEDLWDGISVFSPFILSLFPSYHDYYCFTLGETFGIINFHVSYVISLWVKIMLHIVSCICKLLCTCFPVC